jgi:hypothetical protein
MKIHISAEDVQFMSRDFREHHQRLEAAFNCDGVPCQAPGAPHEPMTPHFHLVLAAPDLKRERLVHIDPTGAWRDDP